MTGKQQRTLIAVVMIVMAGAGVFWFTLRGAGDPKYQGKTLGYWLMHIPNERFPRGGKAEARCAIETLGTNNLQLLLKWLHEPEPEYKEPSHSIVNTVLAKFGIVRPTIVFESNFRISHRTTASRVLAEFPVVSRLALPHLTNMLATGDIEAKQQAAFILGKSTEEAIPFIIPLLSSKKVSNRAFAAYALGEIGKQPELVIPKLNDLLTDPMCRITSVDALLKLKAPPEPLLPIVMQGLHEKYKEASALMFQAHTNLASLAVEPLVEMIKTSTNHEDRQFLFSTLRDIDRNAAEELAQRIPELESKPAGTNLNNVGGSPPE